MRFRFARLFAVLAGISMGLTAQAQEKNIAVYQAAQAAQPAVMDTLKKLVLMESGSANLAGLSKVADFAQERLQSLGAKTEQIGRAHV